MANKSYFKVDSRKAFSSKKYEKYIREAQSKAHQEWANRMAAGYNRIVAGWSESVRPTFKGSKKYMTSTKRVFVYVHMSGPDKAKMVFRMLDYGARRGQRVSAPEGEERPQFESQMAKNPIYIPAPGQKPADIFTSSGVRRNTAEWTIWEARNKEVQRAKRSANKLIKRSKKRQARKKKGPGRTRKGSRLGIQRYTPRTTNKGTFGGPGQSSGTPKKSKGRPDQAWRGSPQPKSVKLGPIAARHWSWRLRQIVIGGQGYTYGAGKIWPNPSTMSQTYTVRKGYREAMKLARRAA